VDREELADPANALIAHETADGWERLETAVEASGGSEVTLSASVESFSLFAVVEIRPPDQETATSVAPTTTTATGGDTTIAVSSPATTTATAPSEPSETPTTATGTPGFGAGVAAVALLAVAILARRRR
jgi:PGF-CTERM protein